MEVPAVAEYGPPAFAVGGCFCVEPPPEEPEVEEPPPHPARLTEAVKPKSTARTRACILLSFGETSVKSADAARDRTQFCGARTPDHESDHDEMQLACVMHSMLEPVLRNPK